MSENRIATAYSGTDSYIFISYSHRNTPEVLRIVRRMQNEGYRVWYDEGIDPGTEWDANIAAHVKGCSYFIAFISDAYLGSDNCKDELNYARDLNKERLLVYLEDVELPDGMAMRLNRLQAMHKYKYDSEEMFFSKLFQTPGLLEFCGKSARNGVNDILNKFDNLMGAKQQKSADTKRCQHCRADIPKDAVICTACGRQVRTLKTEGAYMGASVSTPTPAPTPASGKDTLANAPKSKWVAIILCLFLGILGIHKFYERKYLLGVVYMFTYGLFFVGIIVDLIVLLRKPNPYYPKK